MPLVRSECLLMTSFTNNKPCNQAGKHTAQHSKTSPLYPCVTVDAGREGRTKGEREGRKEEAKRE